MGRIYYSIKSKLLHYSWDIAYGIYDSHIITKGLDWRNLHIVKNPYKEKWFADPFILNVDSEVITLFVEEFDYNVGRGRIAKVIVDRKTDTIVDCVIILDLPTHLSFPAIYRVDNEVIVHPENSQSGNSWAYKYDSRKEQLVNARLILSEPLTDAVIVYTDGGYSLFSTKVPIPNGRRLNEYYSSDFWGPYSFVQEYEYPTNIGRMAGLFISFGDKLIRPAQNCDGAYGRGIFFMQDTNVIGEMKAKGVKYSGLHTFNSFNNIFVVDLKKYDYPILYKIKECLLRP